MGKFVQQRRATRPSRVLRTIEISAWACAAICLAIATGIRADAYLYQRLAVPPVAAIDETLDETLLDRAAPVAPGTPIARLVIPRLDLDVVVAEGASSSVLRKAVGRVAASASPGEDGNIVLAGHRDTFFRALGRIREGDLIILDSGAGEHSYRVEWTRVVEPTDIQVLEPTGDPALTLITCYPFQYVGNAPRRFVVRARGHDS